MADRGTFEQASRIFLEETKTFATSGKMKLGPGLHAAHREYCRRVDSRLREIGWTFEEYRALELSGSEDAMMERLTAEIWPVPHALN